MKFTVIGQGYVGLSLAIGAARVGHDVIGFDIDENLVANLLQGKTFVPGIRQEIIRELILNKSYLPTTSTQKLKGSEVVVITVPTPLDINRLPDLNYLRSAAQLISESIDQDCLIVNESTSYPGTLRNFIKPIIESKSNRNFLYAAAPERIDPGNNHWNLSNTPRVISGLTKESTEAAIKLYKTFCSHIIEVTSPEVAEASKLFENTFRQVNIALANEFAIISNILGFSAHEAISAAATKPFGFLPFFPGIGVGGHCIPIDPTYLSYAAEVAGGQATLINLANTTNLTMVEHSVDLIRNKLSKEIDGMSIQLAGISYKPGIADLRESPALTLMDKLKEKGAVVSWCDPHVIEYKGEKSTELNPKIDLGLIITPHKEINFEIWKAAKTRVFDLSANSSLYGWAKFF